MRFLEIVILVLDLAGLAMVAFLRPGKRGWFRYLPAAGIGVVLIHLAVEKYRWQMLPAYFLAGTLFLFTLPGLFKSAGDPHKKRTRSIVLAGTGFLLWLIAAFLPFALPVPRLPEPPGPEAIGSVVYDWIDPARPEAYSADPDDPRELMVQFWYPAEPAPDAKTMPFIDRWDVAGPAFAGFLGLPDFALGHLGLVSTHTFAEAPLKAAAESFPVVIYSHGYTGYRTASLNQFEALASSGYIVVAIDHTYSAMFTVFSDGRVVVNDESVLPDGDFQAEEVLEGTHAADIAFVLDQLEALNAGILDQRFTGQIDLQRVGLVGISTGGGAIVWACQEDPRCAAGLVMDGWFEPLPESEISTSLQQPFMFMQSETEMWKRDNLDRLEQLYQDAGADAYHLRLSGVLHLDFGDLPLLTPLNGILEERGSLDGPRTLEIMNAYLVAFFDAYLKGRPAALLDGPSPDYPEVEFNSNRP